MNADYEYVNVTNNESDQQYEAQMGDELAILEYERNGNTITYIHTGVPHAMEGHGIASKLAHTALEDARKEHLSVVPQCPFVASYIREHREYLSLLSKTQQERVLRD